MTMRAAAPTSSSYSYGAGNIGTWIKIGAAVQVSSVINQANPFYIKCSVSFGDMWFQTIPNPTNIYFSCCFATSDVASFTITDTIGGDIWALENVFGDSNGPGPLSYTGMKLFSAGSSSSVQYIAPCFRAASGGIVMDYIPVPAVLLEYYVGVSNPI